MYTRTATANIKMLRAAPSAPTKLTGPADSVLCLTYANAAVGSGRMCLKHTATDYTYYLKMCNAHVTLLQCVKPQCTKLQM